MSKVVSSSSTYRFCGGCDDVVLHSYDAQFLGWARPVDSTGDWFRYDYQCCECGFECSEVEIVHVDESEL